MQHINSLCYTEFTSIARQIEAHFNETGPFLIGKRPRYTRYV